MSNSHVICNKIYKIEMISDRPVRTGYAVRYTALRIYCCSICRLLPPNTFPRYRSP